jgi:trigger factor
VIQPGPGAVASSGTPASAHTTPQRDAAPKCHRYVSRFDVMEFKVDTLGPCLSKLTITVPSAVIEQAFTAATRRVGKEVQLPGFRAGKVPRSLIERQYGMQIEQEAVNQVVQNTLFVAIEKAGLTAVSMPTLDFKGLQRGKDFEYTAQVEVQPEIELAQVDGLPVPAKPERDDAPQVAEALEQMRRQHAQTVPVAGRDTVQEGDYVQLSYEGRIDDVPFPGGKADNALVEVRPGEYIPGFVEGLIGATVPGERDVPVDFPADYGAAHLAGKHAIFKMTLQELKEQKLPELDDEFARDAGEDSLEALQAKVGAKVAEQADKEADDKRRRALLEALIAANPFEMPPSMVDNQVERIIENANERLARMTGQKVQMSSDELADMRTSSRADAEFQVRSGLLLMAVAKKEGVSIDEAAMEAEVDRRASEAGEQAERVRKHFAERDAREELRFRLLEERVLALLFERCVPAAA